MMMVAGVNGNCGQVNAAPQGYRLIDNATGEDVALSLLELERLLGIEASYINWAIACDGCFLQGRWRVEPR